MSQAWFWPPNGQSVHSVAASLLGSEIVAFDVFAPQAFPFNPGGASIPLPGAARIVGSTNAADGSIVALDCQGSLYSLPTGGGAAVQTALPSGIYSDIATCNGLVYAVTVGGQVYDVNGNGDVAFGTYVNALTASGTNLIGLCPQQSGGAAIGISASATGTPTFIAVPAAVASPTCCAAASGIVAVGGWGAATWTGNYAAIAADPAVPLQFAAVGGGQVVIYRAPNVNSDAWASTLTLNGVTASPVSAAWTPDGTQILIADTANNVLQVVGYTAGVLSINQNLAITSPVSVAATDATHALVGGNGVIVPHVYSTTWAPISANTLSVSGVTVIIALSATSAIAACTGGIAQLAFISGAWAVTNTVAVGFAPTAMTVDNHGLIYTLGPGKIAVVNGSTVVGTGTWSGQGTGVAAFNQQAVTTDQGNLRVVGAAAGGSAWSSQTLTSEGQGGVVGLAYVNRTLFTYGTSGLQAFDFDKPYTVVPLRKGAVCFYSLTGASWTTVPLTTDHIPSAVSWSSTDLWVATLQNDLYFIAPNGTIATTTTVPQYSGQAQSIPLGVSNLVVNGSSVYAATSLAGLLVQAQ